MNKMSIFVRYMILLILKAFCVGILCSCLLGPAAILVMQKSLSHTHAVGFVTGLGVTTVDTISATISCFALNAMREFISSNDEIIMIIGGAIIIGVGCGIAFINPFRKVVKDNGDTASFKDYIQAVLTAASNPGGLFLMLTLFAFMGLGDLPHDFHALPVIAAVSAGSVCYWFFFSWFFSHIRKNFNQNTLILINRIAGALVILIGVVLVVTGLIKILN